MYLKSYRIMRSIRVITILHYTLSIHIIKQNYSSLLKNDSARGKLRNYFFVQSSIDAASFPCRVATISAIIASAISSGDSAPIFSPIGP